ncbi:hypothetical protein BMETH_363_3 [methanotrophic bacterial endosymbiont of Bathymodiolus sp.]|nr:hypothetical protein BMETH_363_3 [methanotrophic bacterial endosymbiont of Bathymodiolus sp.]
MKFWNPCYQSENKKSSLLLKLCFYNFQQLNSYSRLSIKGLCSSVISGETINSFTLSANFVLSNSCCKSLCCSPYNSSIWPPKVVNLL